MVIKGRTAAITEKLFKDPFSLAIAPKFQIPEKEVLDKLDQMQLRVMAGVDLKIYTGTLLLTVINNVRKKMQIVGGKVSAKHSQDAYLLELYTLLSIDMAPMSKEKVNNV